MKTTSSPIWLRLVTAPFLALPFYLIDKYDHFLDVMGPAFFAVLLGAVVAAVVAVAIHRDVFASLRLTVVLLSLGTALIFFGTLAQVESGIWQIVDKYFRSMFVWVPVDVFRPLAPKKMAGPWPGQFVFPGGFLLLGLLVMNLLAAHAVRYKVRAKGAMRSVGWGLGVASVVLFALTVSVPVLADAIQQDVILMLGIWALPMGLATAGAYVLFGSRKAGIVLVHAGLILLLVGEFVTGLAADEGRMMVTERGASNYIVDIREAELALVTTLADGRERHVVVSPRLLISAAASGEPIDHPDLPLPIRVEGYMPNSDLEITGFEPGDPSRLVWSAHEIETFSGTSEASRVDVPSAYLALPTGTDGRMRRVLVSGADLVPPVAFEVGGVPWRVELRFKRTYVPYTIQLHDFRNETFTGSQVARDFSSKLRIVEADGSGRAAFIKMNQPLRYDGKAFFQTNFYQQPLNQNTGTVMQVAQNPGSWIPYLSCVVVTVGLCGQFGGSLMRYSRRPPAKGVA